MEAAIKLVQPETYSVENPATGKTTGTYALMSRKDVDDTVRTARTAFSSWSDSDFSKRRETLYNAASVLSENA